MIDEEYRAELEKEAQTLPKIPVGDWEASDIEMIGTGAMAPLSGFMTQRDYLSVVREMRLANGTVWPLPVTLAVSEACSKSLRVGSRICLESVVDGISTVLAIMTIQDKYRYDKLHEVKETYKTDSLEHPGVRKVLAQGDVLLGGPIQVINERPSLPFPRYRLTPDETRRIFAERGWSTVVGFQTRNPIHRAHEYIQKCALEICDGLFIHPLVGTTKDDDIPAETRIKSYETILKNYYPSERVLLAVFPAAMRYGGPREAIFHALIRKNYGCTHFIVGRDHAGVGSFYGTYDAQLIFNEFRQDDLGITPLFFEHTFYCRACGSMASSKTCPHGRDEHLILSGTAVRSMLANGEKPPMEFTRPEVAEILMEAYGRKQ